MQLGKKSLCFILLFTLLTLLVYVYKQPMVFAAELNIQDKTLLVLSDVVGLKTELYTINQSLQRDSQLINLAQKETSVYLSSNKSKLEARCSFVNNQLYEIYLSDKQGDLSIKQSVSNTIDIAKGFLERFQNYTQDTLYGKLAAMLNSTKSNLNTTTTSENIQLEVTTTDQKDSDYIWTYVDENGVRADRKNIVLSYEKGQLKGFLNNWPLYNISGTPKISAKQATEIAIEASKNFSYQVIAENGTVKTISGFNIASKSLGHESIAYLNYNNENDARNRDPFMLYPAWYVPIGFDKFYPGDVSGMVVVIWADTGEVSAMQELTVDSGLATSSSTEDKVNTSQETFAKNLGIITLSPFILILSILCFISSNKRLMSRKLFYKRFWGLFLGMSLLFSMMPFLLITLPKVNADASSTKSRIYSYENTTSGYSNYTADVAEGKATAEICNYIGNLTQDYGYDTTNLHGNGTTVESVISNIAPDEQNYDRTMLFHAGHLAEIGWAYQDNYGNKIRDDAIYPQTGLGKHFFVFLWVCVQAENNITQELVVKNYSDSNRGTPIAWTHRDNSTGHPYMSSDG